MLHTSPSLLFRALAASPVALALAAIFPVSDVRAQIRIEAPASVGSVNVDDHNEQQFARGFGFRIKQELHGLNDAELRRHVRASHLKTTGQFAITSFDLDARHDLVVGTSRPGTEVEISLVEPSKSGKRAVVSFRDVKGRLVDVPKEQVGVFKLSGDQVTFELKGIRETDVPIFWDVLLDRSGSMAFEIRKVQQVAAEFMQRLPSQAKCRVTSFNDSFTVHSSGYVPCSLAAGLVSEIRAGGGTDILTPLLAAYRELRAAGNGLKGVVIVTDGIGQSQTSVEAVLSEKSAQTHIFWLGMFKEGHLQQIADTYVYGKRDMEALLNRYFQGINDAVYGQRVITIAKP